MTADKLCKETPLPKIKNCIIYKYDLAEVYDYTCIECEQGYYVFSNECVAV